MTRRLDVFASRRGRACIRGARQGSAEAKALASWLAARSDVVRFAQRTTTGAFDVDYDDRAALAGRFLRALKDKLHTLAPRPSAPFDLEPVHSLPGRVRVRVTGVRRDQVATLSVRALALPGVIRARHLPASDTTLIFFDPQRTSERQLLDTIWRMDPADWPGEPPVPLRWGAALGATTVLVMCVARAAPFPALAFSVTLSTLRPLLRSLDALSRGEISIDVLDVAATFSALAIGMPTTAAFVIWMVAVGDLLLDVSANQLRTALSSIIQRRDREAFRLLPDGKVEHLPARLLTVGDHFVASTGRGIVADGTVVSGTAEIDEKALTGESRLLVKHAGDRVLASSIVVEGEVVVEVKRSGKNTEAARIERILETVGDKPLTLQRNALDFASRLVLPTFGIAATAGILASDVTRTVCVLITDFGTGIRIAVPTTALTAMALAAREGVLFKGAQYLERLAKTDTIVFDKTGTLTNGVPEVVEVVTRRGFKETHLIQLSASAESRHDHPVARALKSYAARKHLALVEPAAGSEQYTVGLGLSAQVRGHHVRVGREAWLTSQHLSVKRFERQLRQFKRSQLSHLCVAVDDEVVGLIGYSDGTRPESAAIVHRLRAGGKRQVVLLSGDNPDVVRNVASEVGIDYATGGLRPDEKADYVKRLRDAGRVVAMVGDGINDAPAMASADVGISLAGSTDVALETADVILLEAGLARLEKAFTISDRAMRSVRQNIGVVMVPNAVAIALGAFGLISPPIAAVINNGATVLAVLVGTLPLLETRVDRSRHTEAG